MTLNLTIITIKKELSKIIARRKRINEDGDENEERKRKTNANAHFDYEFRKTMFCELMEGIIR
jgi:hypothetical protein